MNHLRSILWNSLEAFHCTQPVRGLVKPSDHATVDEQTPAPLLSSFHSISAHKTYNKKDPFKHALTLCFCHRVKVTFLEEETANREP